MSFMLTDIEINSLAMKHTMWADVLDTFKLIVLEERSDTFDVYK